MPGMEFVEEIAWTKAHILDKLGPEEVAAMTPQERWEATGNQHADVEAKAAMDCHPALEKAAMMEVDAALKHLNWIHKLMAGVLRLWPRLPQGMQRFPTGARVGRTKVIRPPNGHVWGPVQRGWTRCTRCWAANLVDASTPGLDIKKADCPGRPPLLDKLGGGHDVWLHPCGGDNIIICHSCWAYAARKLKGLASQCEGRRALTDSEGRRTVKRRVEQGLHPSDAKHLKGVKLDGHGIQYVAGM